MAREEAHPMTAARSRCVSVAQVGFYRLISLRS
jgi:hypothetical protein